MGQIQPLFKALTSQEKPLSIGSLLLMLVLSLHLWAAIWMRQPAEAVTKAQPMIMEVSLVATPNQQVAAVPPVLAYNFFLRRIKQHRVGLENFVASFLHIALNTDKV